MNRCPSLCTLLVIEGLLTISCVPVRQRGETATDSKQTLTELVERAKCPCRERWFPSVEQLGSLAAASGDMRDTVWRLSRVNTAGMKFVWVEPGAFQMGPGGDDLFESRQHLVELSRGFFIATTEVTNAQMVKVLPDYQPYTRTSPRPDTPAVEVTWEQADLFCKILSRVEGARYRLPTEAEWEYACRAGSDTTYCFGDDPQLLAEYAWYCAPYEPAAPVASFKPNQWGIYDMYGNALEWVSDWYHPYSAWVPEGGVLRDPSGPDRGLHHVARGGYWAACGAVAFTSDRRGRMPLILDRPLFCELFDRTYVGVREATGFRVVREAD